MREMRAADIVRNGLKQYMLANAISLLRTKYERFRSKDKMAKWALVGRYLLRYGVLLPFELVFVFLGLIVYVTLVVLEPYKKVRIGIMKYKKMPAYGTIMELFLRRRSIGKDVSIDRVANWLHGTIEQVEPAAGRVPLGRETGVKNDKQLLEKPKDFWVFLSGKPANYQLMAMIKRHVLVLEHPWAWRAYNLMLRRYVAGSRFHPAIPLDLNDYEVWNSVPPQLSFTPEEQVRGVELLKSVGIDPSAEFICFYARDEVYLKTKFPERDWSYHNHRNCDIDNCIPAAEYLAGQGNFALRMGYIVEKPLRCRHPRVIDYATHHRSDFGDIYLLAKCKFFLGSNSGLASVPLIFNRPVALTNVIDVTGPATGSRDLTIFKKLWFIEEKRFMTFREIFARGVYIWLNVKQYTQEEYKQAGIEPIENSADEILALAKEMNERLNGTWVGKDEDEELQARFRSLLPPGFPWIGFPGRIGAEFLRQNRQLLD